MTNNSDKYVTVKVRRTTKAKLDKLKYDDESYNTLYLRLMRENASMKRILLNVDQLKKIPLDKYVHTMEKRKKVGQKKGEE